jgi:hypothetical protein
MHVSGNRGYVNGGGDSQDVGSGIDRVCNCRKLDHFFAIVSSDIVGHLLVLYRIININI